MTDLQPKDLRPGNWIYKKGFELVENRLYTAKKKKNFYFLVTKDNIKDVINNLDDYEAIRIDKQSMANLGFECKSYKDGILHNNCYNLRVNDKLYSIDDSCPYFVYYEGNPISYMKRTRMSNEYMEYIHLIQNTYFDYTDEVLQTTFKTEG